MAEKRRHKKERRYEGIESIHLRHYGCMSENEK